MWVTKLLIFPVEIRIFCPKTTKFGPNWHFWSIWARPCRLIQCPVVGRLVVVARGLYLARHLFTLYIFSFSAHFAKEGGDVVADQHLHRLHHRQLPHCENHSKRLGDCPQVRSLFLVSFFLKKIEPSVENVLCPGQNFLRLLIKKNSESLAAKVH